MLTIREPDLQSLAVIYDMDPDTLTAMLLLSGVLTVDRPARSTRPPAARKRRPSGRKAAAPRPSGDL